MPGRTTLQHTVVAALAASALVATPALAGSAERVDQLGTRTSSLAGTTSPRQDLRGEHAKDAARAAEPSLAAQPPLPGGRPASPLPPETPVSAPSTGGDDDIWLVLGIGLAATGLVAGGAGAARHYRVRARRVAA